MTKYLFVYGTLLPGQAPAAIAHAVKRLRVVGEGRIRGRLYDLGDFPAAVVNLTARSAIRGLVYALPCAAGVLSQLDAYEGFNPRQPECSLFRRKRRLIELNNGRRLLSWIYEFNGNPPARLLLPDGNYRNRRRSKTQWPASI